MRRFPLTVKQSGSFGQAFCRRKHEKLDRILKRKEGRKKERKGRKRDRKGGLKEENT